jgi:cell division protein FtsB
VIYLSRDYIYVNENDRIIRKEFSYEKGIVTSSIGYKDILNITFKLPKTVDKDMLEIEAEKYVFTEGSLDYNKEYKINYEFREFEDYYNVEAFVVETDVLKKEFEKYLKVFKYIDFISVKPKVFQSYYDITATASKNDAFIYLDEEEAFLSCFEKGEFVFVKSISKLSALAKQLDKSVKEVVEILKTKGLDAESYEDSEIYSVVEGFFSQFFMKVNNLINYSVSYYSLSKIERIFFYSPFEIKGLVHNYESFWNLSGIEFKKYVLENTDYNPFEYTAAVYNSRHYSNEKENFSIFPKPVPFYKTKTGVLLLLALVCFGFVAADATFKYHILKRQEEKILILKRKVQRIKREEKLLKTAVVKFQKKEAKLREQNSDLQKQISDISEKVLYLENIQRQEPVSNQMADLVRELKKYGLKLISFDKNDTKTEIVITSSFDNSADIARLMKDLSSMGYKNVTSNEIKNTLGIYIAKVSYDE